MGEEACDRIRKSNAQVKTIVDALREGKITKLQAMELLALVDRELKEKRDG